MGDFNDLLHSSEKRGKNKHPKWKLHGFQKAISDAGLFDLGMSGYQFTWERSRGCEDWVEERLDRGLASSSWIYLFPTAKVTSVEASCSDHLPVFLEPVPMVQSPRTKKFCFENSWLREPDCFNVVKISWASTSEVPIQNRLASCGIALLHGATISPKISKLTCRIAKGRWLCFGANAIRQVWIVSLKLGSVITSCCTVTKSFGNRGPNLYGLKKVT